MSSRMIVQVFQTYQKARTAFVQSIAEMALKAGNLPALDDGNALALLEPLLADICPSIRQCACVALARIIELQPAARTTPLVAAILPKLLDELATSRNQHVRQSALYVMRAIAKCDVAAAEEIIAGGGLTALINAMGDFDAATKESALCAVGYIARHAPDLAQSVVDAGVIPHIVLCLQESAIPMKCTAASVLADIARHSGALAQCVADGGAIPHLARALAASADSAKLKRIALHALASVAKHGHEMAHLVVECNTFPSALVHLAHACPRVQRAAASLVRDVVKHSLALSRLVVHLGGVGALLECCRAATPPTPPDVLIPCYVALGYMAGQSEQVALAMIEQRAVATLHQSIDADWSDGSGGENEAVMAVALWAVGQVGKHSAVHAAAIANAGLLTRMLAIYNGSGAHGGDVREKSKNALKLVLQKCMVVDALQPLINNATPPMLKYVLGQFARILPNEPKARRAFVTSGALKRMQELDAEPGTTLYEYVSVINACFPAEIVRYYTPGYSDELLDLVEQYAPETLSQVLREAHTTTLTTPVDIDDGTSTSSLDVNRFQW